MAGEVELPTGGKLRRRATIFMTGAALSAFYVWMQPAALGTLEANSAQAADGSTSGCVLKVGSTPLTVGGKEVRVQSNELCNGAKPSLAATPPAPIIAAAPPAELLRSTVGEDTNPLPPAMQRFSRAVPRSKPDAPTLVSERPDVAIAEPAAERDDVERDHIRLAEREDRPDGPDDKPDDDRPDDRDDGGESSSDGGEREEVCERDDGGESGGEGGERDDDRADGGEGGEGGESGGEGRSR